MSYNITDNQKIFMEITNPIHGGEGWDFGEVLWSPATSSWKIMTKIKPGDLIMHSMKPHGANSTQQLMGASLVKGACTEVYEEPPVPGEWSKSNGYDSYYKIQLQSYSSLKSPLLLSEFFKIYQIQLKSLGDVSSFYEKSPVINRPVQKYMAPVPQNVFLLLLDYIENNNALFDNVLVENEEDEKQSDLGVVPPGRIKTTTERIIRDTKIVKVLKEKYNNKCQICGKTIIMPNGNGYSEGHHLQKLGSSHMGPDISENIIILCPYHHVEFDYGIIGIDPKTKKIEHINNTNEYDGNGLAYERNDVDLKYLEYHMKHIFNK